MRAFFVRLGQRAQKLRGLLLYEPRAGGEVVERPTREQLRDLPLAERRMRKIEYAAQGGLFRTWVYVVALVAILAAAALLIVTTG